MTTKTILLGLGGLALAAVSTFGLVSARWERTDCPGKITCPLTGEVICRDQCPRVDADRGDCPGRIECPDTGELACVDRCTASEETSSRVASCCSTRE
jgi:hypothetical protein